METVAFRLYLWPHRLLLTGPAFDTGVHRHHAAQLAVGLDGPLQVRSGEQAPWQETPAFYVPPDIAHGFDAGNTPCALLYLDPEGTECRQVCTRYGHNRIHTLTDTKQLPIDALRALARGEGERATANRACATILGQTAPPTARRDFDPRLQRALDWLDARLDEPVRLSAVASAAKVSPSWLSHRFSEDVGVPLRRYVLWRRLRLASETTLRGATLTEAAHAAGFADSAHLTRTFRESFGVAPSLLFATRDALAVTFMD